MNRSLNVLIALMLIAVAVALPDFMDQDDDFSAEDGAPYLVSAPIVPLAAQQVEDAVVPGDLNDDIIARVKRQHGHGHGGYGGYGGYGGGYGGYGGGYGGYGGGHGGGYGGHGHHHHHHGWGRR